MFFSKLFALSAVLSVVGVTAASASPNLVADGGFEMPQPYPIGYWQYFGGEKMGAWNVLGNDILSLDSTHFEGSGPELYFNAHSGLTAIDLTGNGNTGFTDGISQEIETDTNKAYRLAFYVGNQTGSGSFGHYYTKPSTVDLQVNGGVRAPFTNSNTIANGVDWKGFSTTIVATGSKTTITFLNGTPTGDNYAGLDDVSMTAVPELSAWIMMILGSFGVGAGLRQRQGRTSSPR